MFQLPIRRRFPELESKLGVVTTPVGGQTAYEKFHPGVDIANHKGTPIPPPVSGFVTQVVSGRKQGDQGFGNSVTVKDAQGNQHQLGHLEQPNVRVGQRVQAGQGSVGTMGNSGAAYSPSGKGDGTHLDYRIVSAYGKYKNPMTYVKNFNKYGR